MLADLADLVLPTSCVACRLPGTHLCERCAPRGPLVQRRIRGVTVVAAGEYADGLRAALLAYKERHRRDLAATLGVRLAAVVDGWLLSYPQAVLVPVPSATSVARQRGGDHVLRLARRAAGGNRVPVVRALRMARSVADSAGLGVDERFANLAFAFVADPPGASVVSARAVLVDDIVTTGATLAEGARALTAAGWALAGAAVVAATPRRASSTSGPTGLT